MMLYPRKILVLFNSEDFRKKHPQFNHVFSQLDNFPKKKSCCGKNLKGNNYQTCVATILSNVKVFKLFLKSESLQLYCMATKKWINV